MHGREMGIISTVNYIISICSKLEQKEYTCISLWLVISIHKECEKDKYLTILKSGI